MFSLLFKIFSPLSEILTWTENGCYTHTTVESTPVSQQKLNPVWYSDNPPNTFFPLSEWKLEEKKTIYLRTHFPNIFAEKKHFVYHLAKTCLLFQKHEKINVSTLIHRKMEKNKVDSILFIRFLRNISFRLWFCTQLIIK